mmetsp:Transcript_48657/g.106000  ORF Transcript_48657/g.106000 Transcript_48657/m.106000 type:complete len:260 (+) Transcript_48657:133-912(+)
MRSYSSGSGSRWARGCLRPDLRTMFMNCSTSKSSRSMSPDLSYLARLFSSERTENASETFWNFRFACGSSRFLSGWYLREHLRYARLISSACALRCSPRILYRSASASRSTTALATASASLSLQRASLPGASEANACSRTTRTGSCASLRMEITSSSGRPLTSCASIRVRTMPGNTPRSSAWPLASLTKMRPFSSSQPSPRPRGRFVKLTTRGGGANAIAARFMPFFLILPMFFTSSFVVASSTPPMERARQPLAIPAS